MKKEKKLKSYKFYYLFGIIFITLSILIIVVSITLPIALKEEFDKYNYLGWISLVFTVLGIILFFISIYFLKKGSYLKLNKSLYESKKEFENDLDKKINKN